MNMKRVLLHWVSEREKIRKLKEAGAPQPWTDDPILQTYRFCNVRRRHDKVSQWLINNFYSTPTSSGVYESGDFLQWVALCRFINWPPTLAEAYGAGWWGAGLYDPQAITQSILNRQARGEKIFSNAYMIRGGAEKGVSKIPYIVEVTCGINIKRRAPNIRRALETGSREKVALAFGSINNWGTFMSGQVTDDLTWSPLLANPVDDYTWAPIGPGSSKGFNRMLKRPITTPIKPKEWSKKLQLFRKWIITELGNEFSDMTLHDVQNCMCEISKYCRVIDGGRMKNTYRPKEPNEW